jgi:hypothetical protein
MDRKYTQSDCWIFPAGADGWERGLRYKTHTSLAQFAADENDATT